MTPLSRRGFLSTLGAAVAMSRLPLPTASPVRRRAAASFDPWLEIDGAAIAHNVAEVARLAGGRPILAVVKNNAYGLGLAAVGPMLASLDTVTGLAVVKPQEAVALRDAGVRKPILLMGPFSRDEALDLAARDVRLVPYSGEADEHLTAAARRLGRQVPIHFDVDTGMSRLGLPYRDALPRIERLARRPDVSVEGTFTTFTEDDAFDPEQLERFLALARGAQGRGLNLGRLHAASSHALFHRPAAHLDMVRPGLVLYGAYPAAARGLGRATLRPAFRLRARVVRVERLEVGESVSYGRSYVAQRPTWIATLPVGHADGYSRAAVKGCEVLIAGRLYRVIGAVSASHTIVEVGDEKTVDIGAEATLVGPDHLAVHPNTVAERAGISVYDVLMHLSAGLPKRAVRGGNGR